MPAIRIITGLMLALVVSVINGMAGIGYTVGGEFESAMHVVGSGEGVTDSRWKSEGVDPDATLSPRNVASALSLLVDTRYGRFGLSLQVLCFLQFIAGVVVIFRRKAGAALAVFLSVVGLAGIGVEIVGVRFSSTWGITNAMGTVISAMLILVSILMYRVSREGPGVVDAA